MSKCKKNILLIFGFLLIVNLLFIPCNEIYYGFSLTADKGSFINTAKYIKKNRWERANYVKVFFPVIFNRATEYKKYVEWESEAFLIFDKKKKAGKGLDRERDKLLKKLVARVDYDYDEKKSSPSSVPVREELEFLRAMKKDPSYPQLISLNKKLTEINEEISETYRKKQNEISEKFKYPTIYHQFSTKFFLGELVLLILVGSLAHILLCIVLRKRREKKREAGRDVIKERKIGVILTLIGIGIIFIFSQFNKGGEVDIEIGDLWLEFPYGYPFAIGIILVLIGAGKIVFSFFPKEEKPKKEVNHEDL